MLSSVIQKIIQQPGATFLEQGDYKATFVLNSTDLKILKASLINCIEQEVEQSIVQMINNNFDGEVILDFGVYWQKKIEKMKYEKKSKNHLKKRSMKRN